MKLGGYANRVAHVDLTAGKVEYKAIPEEWAIRYIGARGRPYRRDTPDVTHAPLFH